MILKRKDFQLWMAKNRMHFIFDHYAPNEIFEVAIAVGFDRRLVTKILSNFEYALAGMCPERGARAAVKRVVDTVLVRSGLGLDEQWNRLGRYLEDGVEFEEVA